VKKPTKNWDVFVSHASADKVKFVTPLAEALRERGIKVWLDQWEIDLGDSISGKITHGLRESRFGIVVLSKAFFAGPWPKKELGALFAQENSGATHIFPIWYQLEADEVLAEQPLLADRMAARSSEGIRAIADRLSRLLARDTQSQPRITDQDVRELTNRLFPGLPVNEFWQAQMLADIDPHFYRSIEDIELAYRRAREAVEVYAKEEPGLFNSGTSYLTKSLGFVDLCFRSRHNWAQETKDAFLRHQDKVRWDKGMTANPKAYSGRKPHSARFRRMRQPFAVIDREEPTSPKTQP
jgi:hypothetical protein